MRNIYIHRERERERERDTHTIMTLDSYRKVSRRGHNKLVRKSECNEHEAPYYEMISPHRLVTPLTNYGSDKMCTKTNTTLLA